MMFWCKKEQSWFYVNSNIITKIERSDVAHLLRTLKTKIVWR